MIGLNDLFKEAVLEKIEEDIDLDLYKQAIEDFKKNPVFYTHDEVKKELGL